jgi:serine/threonine-protein kinase
VIGETLDHKYRIVRLLGRGGMGTVYEAERLGDGGARVAVKVLHSHLLDPGGEARRRFEREAAVARSIRSPHVARVLDAGRDTATGQLYLVTELLEGEDLQQRLDRAGPLLPEGAIRVALQALAGLCDAHATGVVHRDIKPANLFLARGEGGAITVKLLDFGVAKIRVDPLVFSAGPSLASTSTCRRSRCRA